MKKIYLAGLALCCMSNVQADIIRTDHTSQMRMVTRPAYQNVSAMWNWWSPTVVKKSGESRAAVQGLGFYQKSVDWCQSASYFLINCKSSLLVQGDAVQDHRDRDVRAEWLGLPPETDAYLTLTPRQRQISAVFEFNQDIATWLTHNFFAHLWFDITASFSQVKNALNPRSNDSRLIHQIGRPELQFARISDCEFTSGGMAETILSIGATFLDNNDGFLLATSTGIGLPGERRVSSEFIFYPILGTFGHITVPTTVIFALPIYVCEERGDLLQFVGNLQHRFYTARDEWRTFDLRCQREWSRYLLLRRPGDEETIPATHVLTRYVQVRPHSFINVAASFVFSHEGLGAEAGYELWAHSDEEIRHAPQCCYPEKYPLEKYGIAGSTKDTSASQSTISNQAENDSVFRTLKESDIDYSSGRAPSTGSHRFHAALSYRGDSDALISLGAFFEWPQTNGCLKNYGCWGKLAYSW